MTTRAPNAPGKRTVGKEQYFTSPDLAKRCVEFVDNLLDLDSFSSVIEPSAGTGAFFELLPETNRIGIDLHSDPNDSPDIIQSDFLDWLPSNFTDSTKSQGSKVLTIGNPPFGQRSSLAFKFIHHASSFSEAIAFILPRSFNKYTFQNRIPELFHLKDSFDCAEFLTPDGEEVLINCVFQVWEKKKIARPHKRMLTTHPDFEMKHAHLSRITTNELTKLQREYPFTIPQVGGNFSPQDSSGASKGSRWFIKPLASGVKERFEQADYSFLEGMNLAHTSLSRSDIVRAYTDVTTRKP